MKYIEHPGFIASSTLIRCWYNIIAPLNTRILYWFDKHGLNRPTYGARDWIKVRVENYHFILIILNPPVMCLSSLSIILSLLFKL